MDAGLLPVKPISRAKQRLAPVLGDLRESLARALVEDALDLVSADAATTWWVVTEDEWVASQAERRGVKVLGDPGTGLNGALQAGVDTALGAGATSVTILPADVPLATRSDLQDLLDTGATSDIVIVPANRGGGTNALYLSPPDALATHFGTDSLRAHLDEAAARGLRCAILSLPRIALDLDTWEDALEILKRARDGGLAVSLLRDVAERLAAES